MLNMSDLEQMRATTAAVMSDHQVSITIRRNDDTLAPQDVRVERARSQSMRKDGKASEESRTRILVVGATDLDIQKDDRFNALNGLYRVTFVRPNRQIDTQAEAELIE